MDIAYAIVGLVILLLSGDALVRGAVNTSLRLGVPALIVSLTIVAIGTSAPELLVAVDAVIKGAPGIALGNVVGSNTANVLLVLGLPALLAGLGSTDLDTRPSYLQMLGGTAVFVAVAAFAPITWITGLVLLGLFVAFILREIHAARCHRRDEKARRKDRDDIDVEGVDPSLRWRMIALLLVLGLIGLPLGAELLVSSATRIAREYQISDTVIGLTLVAVGTSLPELATTVSAAFRRQADVAIGNVIGSNMANILGIVGIATLFGPIPVPHDILRFDILVMAAASLIIAPFVFTSLRLTRTWGFLFVGGYVIYIAIVLN